MADKGCNEECQAQVALVELKLSINVIQRFKAGAKWICGCDVTLDGKRLVTDNDNGTQRLIGFYPYGNRLFTLSTSTYHAFDVTCIDGITVAVTSGHNQVISIVDISSLTVKKRINVGYPCYGVTYKDGKLLVCAEDHGILSINLTDEKITTIVRLPYYLPSLSYITTYKDNLYYTNPETKTVTCCDTTGNKIWTFKDDDVLQEPRGIAVDNKGQVYVADTCQSSIVVLYNDGKQSETIIRSGYEDFHVYALSYDKTRDNLFVGNSKNEAFLISLS